MTPELLKDVLTERAEAAPVPDADLTAIEHRGERRLRRRRTSTVVGAVALTVAAVAGGIAAVRDTAGAEPPAVSAPPPFAERRATWATGDTIHYGTELLKAGPARIAAFVQTDSAFVYVSTDGAVYAADRDGVRPIGSGNIALRLTAGPAGSLVGWVDQRPPVPEFVVYDVAAGKEILRTGRGNRSGLRSGNEYASGADQPPAVPGIDGGDAYFEAGDGLYRWDLATGAGTRIRSAGSANHLMHAAGGTLFSTRSVEGSGDISQVASADPAADRPAFPGLQSYPSPNGRRLLIDGMVKPRVIDLGTGRQVPLQHPGYQLVRYSQWLDDGRFTAVGFRGEKTPLDLLTCSAATGRCVLTVRDFTPAVADEDQPAVQLPFGRTIADAG